MTLLKGLWRLVCFCPRAALTSSKCFDSTCFRSLKRSHLFCTRHVLDRDVQSTDEEEDREKMATSFWLLNNFSGIGFEDRAMLDFLYWLFHDVKTVSSKWLVARGVFKRAFGYHLLKLNYNFTAYRLGDGTNGTCFNPCTWYKVYSKNIWNVSSSMISFAILEKKIFDKRFLTTKLLIVIHLIILNENSFWQGTLRVVTASVKTLTINSTGKEMCVFFSLTRCVYCQEIGLSSAPRQHLNCRNANALFVTSPQLQQGNASSIVRIKTTNRM